MLAFAAIITMLIWLRHCCDDIAIREIRLLPLALLLLITLILRQRHIRELLPARLRSYVKTHYYATIWRHGVTLLRYAIAMAITLRVEILPLILLFRHYANIRHYATPLALRHIPLRHYAEGHCWLSPRLFIYAATIIFIFHAA